MKVFGTILGIVVGLGVMWGGIVLLQERIFMHSNYGWLLPIALVAFLVGKIVAIIARH
jgi:hypothetical protein